MSDDEKFINNKTIIKFIGIIVIIIGIHYSNYGKIKFVVYITAVICAILTILHFYQENCSDYQCPDGYLKDESKKDTECESFTCDSDDKDTCCNSKQKCSEYTCPTGYEGKDNVDNIYCKDIVCKESDDKDTCCNKSVNCEGSWSDFGGCSVECGGGTQTRTYTITKQPQYGGTPCPTSPESQPCNTEACAVDVVENATCSTVSGNCPDGYLYKTDSAGTACAATTCDMGISGADLETCCEQGCTAPSSIPTGYTGSLPDTLPVGVGDITGVQCDTNYHGTPTYNCATAGEDYTVAGGCDPDMCTTPDTTGYNITSVTSLERNNFPVNVTCEDGYGPSTQGDIPQASCSGDSVEYSLTGCENKTGFCSGNTDSSNDFDCTSGYNLKDNSNTIVGNTNEDCCDQITPEAEPSGTQSEELPACNPSTGIPDKEPTNSVSTMQNSFIDCARLCALAAAAGGECLNFSYSELEDDDFANCLIGGEDIPSETPEVQWKLYPRCNPD